MLPGMKLVWTLAVAAVAATMLLACGGGGGGGAVVSSPDQAALEQLVKDLGAGMESANAGQIIALFSSDCPNLSVAVANGLSAVSSSAVNVNVTGVDVRNLNGDSAEVRAKGTITVAGVRQPLEDSGYISVKKQNGQWVFSDCSFVGAVG